MCKTTFLILLLLVTLTTSPIRAQVTARQGTPAEDVREFTSPMLLDLELPDLAALTVGQSLPFDGVRQYVCDDTSILRLFVHKVKQSKQGGPATFEFEGTAYVRKSHDRLVYLEFRLADGDQPLVLARVVNLDVEEEEIANFKARFKLDGDQLGRLFGPGTEPKLTLLVSVRDNL